MTRVGCHLCVEAEVAVRDTCEDLGVDWRTLDIDSDDDLRARYTDHVPVTFVDQRLLGYWFLDAEDLRARLLAGPARPMPDGWLPPADQP